jgi:surface polysaccharide O-acyltransferase-like enzyme
VSPAPLQTGAARTVACALVVLVHVNYLVRAGMTTWWPGGVPSALLYAVAVPTFVLLSGLYAAPPEDPARPRLRRRLVRLIPPFVVWNLVLLGLGAEGTLSPTEVGIRLLSGMWQLYYIGVLVQLLALAALLEPRVTGRAAWGLFAAAIGLTVVTYAVSDALLWVGHYVSRDVEILVRRGCFAWSAPYALGVALRRHPPLLGWLRRRLGLLVALTALTGALYLFELQLEEQVLGFDARAQIVLGGLPFQLVAPLALLIGLDRAAGTRWARSLAHQGPDTFGVYLVHTPILIGVWALDRAWGLPQVSAWEVPVLGALVGAASVGLVRSLRLFPQPVPRLVLGEPARAEG